jgi:hypothetical protein
MTFKVVAREFVIPTAFAIGLTVVLSIGAACLINNYLGPIERAEASHMIIGPINPRP